MGNQEKVDHLIEDVKHMLETKVPCKSFILCSNKRSRAEVAMDRVQYKLDKIAPDLPLCEYRNIFHIGSLAHEYGNAAISLLPDIPFKTDKELETVVTDLYMANRSKYPIAVIGTGNLATAERLKAIRPFAEKLFDFINLDGGTI